MVPQLYITIDKVDNLSRIAIQLNGQVTTALIDTGASIHFINANIVDCTSPGSSLLVQLATTNQCTRSRGIVTVATIVQRHHYDLTFTVVDNLGVPATLGLPFMYDFGVQILMTEQSLQSADGHSIPFVGETPADLPAQTLGSISDKPSATAEGGDNGKDNDDEE